MQIMKLRMVRMILVVIFLTFLVPQSGSLHLVHASSAEQAEIHHAPLQLELWDRGGRYSICAGRSYPLNFVVRDALEYPVPNATVTVSDAQGNTLSAITSNAGLASVIWSTETPGLYLLTAVPEKDTYDPAKPLKFNVRVISCSYILTISFQEESTIIEDSLAVGATTYWKGYLGSRTLGETEEIYLEEGHGEYEFYATNDIKNTPLLFFVDPPVSGEYVLYVDGSVENGKVRLHLRSQEVSYPQLLTLGVMSGGQYKTQETILAPVATGAGNGLFLDFNRLTDLTFPSTGGVISLMNGMSCYVNPEGRTKYLLTIILQPYREYGP